MALELSHFTIDTGAACGPGNRESIKAVGNSTNTSKDITTEHTWNKVMAESTIPAGTRQVTAYITTAAGGGQPNKVTLVVEKRDGACNVLQTIIDEEKTMDKGTFRSYTWADLSGAEIIFNKGDILTVRMVRTQGARAQTFHYNHTVVGTKHNSYWASEETIHPPPRIMFY